ncbi:conserved protein of unknown function [Rhodovastum atsumiense]|uniref:Uncharacterized protein n=1 Tax=Rhodovastum atsumiense TaxID=504468 RepID=A0A5M6IKV2_9PROT|nr:hypothetical protein [Rhodovastum atsumiense]KAA5608198.1 hypothetical protein F1189_30235 [Rhodovastum atsumiense]CAH2602563.1 conserved protein of unknown function [Rhodovastum atsumiense]
MPSAQQIILGPSSDARPCPIDVTFDAIHHGRAASCTIIGPGNRQVGVATLHDVGPFVLPGHLLATPEHLHGTIETRVPPPPGTRSPGSFRTVGSIDVYPSFISPVHEILLQIGGRTQDLQATCAGGSVRATAADGSVYAFTFAQHAPP